jgi:cytochrome c
LGQLAFDQQCGVCHTVEKGGPDRYGPNLFGIVGRQAGAQPNFVYSAAFKKAATWKWDASLIGGWISNPGALIPGNAMAVFQGVADKDRDNIIAYLATLK